MSEAEHGRFEPATTADAGDDSAPLVEPEGVNAGSADESRDAGDTDGPADDVRSSSRQPAPDMADLQTADAGSQDEGDELLGAPADDQSSGQDSGSME